MRQTLARYCASSSPSTSCSVKFFEPTAIPRVRVEQAAQKHRIPERKPRRSMSMDPAHQQLLDPAQAQVGHERHQCGGNRAGKDHSVVHHGNAAEDELAETAGADGGGDGGYPDGDY